MSLCKFPAFLTLSLALGCPVLLPAQTPTVAPIVLGDGAVPLDGLWQFHLGDNPAWAGPNLDDTAGHNGWEQIDADKPWGKQGHEGYIGYAWYRRAIRIDPHSAKDLDAAMLITKIDDLYEVYWNGALVYRYGQFPPHPVWYTRQPAQTFGLGPAQSGELAIRVWKVPLLSQEAATNGGLNSVPLFGSVHAIAASKDQLDYSWLRARQFIFGQNSLIALLMLLSFLAWARNRSQRLFLWIALFCLSRVVYLLNNNMHLLLSVFQREVVQIVFAAVYEISLWYVMIWLLELRSSARVVRLTRIVAIVFSTSLFLDLPVAATDWFTRPEWYRLLMTEDWIVTIIYTVLGIYPIVLILFALGKRLDLARWLVAGLACLSESITVWQIGASQGQRYTHWTVSERLAAPLFSINGNSFTPLAICDTFLLFSIIYAVFKYQQETMRRQSTLEQEFQNAREIQRILIPENLPTIPGYMLTSAYQPAQEVGGDFFQIIPLEDNSILIVLGDVSGKGLRAAMTVSLIVGTIRTLAETTSSPAQILAGLNRRLHGRLRGGFATCIVLHLNANASGGVCRLASAGHPGPFLNQEEVYVPGALPLGLMAETTYPEFAVTLPPGDQLSFYTDGLLEARNPAGELYGFDRLKTLFAAHPTAAQATTAAVDFGQDDDITVLTLTRLAVLEKTA